METLSYTNVAPSTDPRKVWVIVSVVLLVAVVALSAIVVHQQGTIGLLQSIVDRHAGR